MARSTAEIALGRALAWLRWTGAPPGPETTRLAVGILAQVLAHGDADLIERVMEALSRQAAAPETHLPTVTPRITRISISYPPYR